MTDEDKKRISEYMRWTYEPDRHCIVSEGKNRRRIAHNLDLNDAALCVQEMQKRGDWQKFCATGFVIYFEKKIPIHIFPENYIAWLSNAENFFNAMSEWLKEGK